MNDKRQVVAALETAEVHALSYLFLSYPNQLLFLGCNVPQGIFNLPGQYPFILMMSPICYCIIYLHFVYHLNNKFVRARFLTAIYHVSNVLHYYL